MISRIRITLLDFLYCVLCLKSVPYYFHWPYSLTCSWKQNQNLKPERQCQVTGKRTRLLDSKLITNLAAAAAKSPQSCLTLCDPIDGSPPGCPIPGILQVRTLEWVAISFSSAWKWKVKVKSLSRVRLLAAPWTAAYQAPPSMRFSRQEHWSGVPLSLTLGKLYPHPSLLTNTRTYTMLIGRT